jgi:hypothetical protein
VYQPGAGAGGPSTYAKQNIFCHTWSVWFLEQVMKNDLNIKQTLEELNNKCGTSATNLILIKKYAIDLSSRYLEHKPSKAFHHIWKPVNKTSEKII